MSLTKNDTQFTPQKVLDLALDLGVHESCVEADLEGACSQCITLFHAAFDTYYGHADNANDALMMILSDILEDKDDSTP